MTELPKDPICGMAVDTERAVTARLDGKVLYFCSTLCRQEFFRRPEGANAIVHEAPIGRRIAYFSMEIAIDPRMPTYAGGLGVLAGDTLRSCADLEVPIVAISIAWRKGYFAQRLDDRGEQKESAASWAPERSLAELPVRVSVDIEGRRVALRIFKHELVGAGGYVVPVLLLDADLPENTAEDRPLTDSLYGGDDRVRLAQEIILGIGGVRALGAAGYDAIARFHLNEGHAALAGVELLRVRGQSDARDIEAVRSRCVFTTHTPVPAAYDRFSWDLVTRVLGEPVPRETLTILGGRDRMNMTMLASSLSHFVNGVARAHSKVSEHLFPGRDIRHVTNGVHSVTWTSPSFRDLFDRHVPEWRDDPQMLRKAISIPGEHVWAAHGMAKEVLLTLVHERTGRELSRDRLTIGFARRAAAYKRADLIFRDMDRLRAIGTGCLQLVFAGKAHPSDEDGRAMIRHVFEASRDLGDDVPIVYLADYDIDLAKQLVAGVDVWLNTPLPPWEASGTSGMKAAHNGVPSLSVLDGWWLEGCIEGVTGWAIGSQARGGDASGDDARSLYERLERAVLPAFTDRTRWMTIMQHVIALNASFFNTHRMVQQYVTNAYLA